MPSNVSAMRLLSKPRMMRVPPAEPNGSLLVKLTPGSWLMTSLMLWPGTWRWMNSEFRTSRVLLVAGASTPPTARVRVPVTTIASFSMSTVPVDWAAATDGMASALVAHNRINFFMSLNPLAQRVGAPAPAMLHFEDDRERPWTPRRRTAFQTESFDEDFAPAKN